VVDGYLADRVDTTNSVVLVQSVPMLSMMGKTDDAANQGSSVTVSIYWSTSDIDTGVNVTAFNRIANVGANKWVVMSWNPWGGSNGTWEIHSVQPNTATLFTA
jgi:hypothetical protein